LRSKASVPLSLELLIRCRDGTVASALNDVLMPDNRYFPKDQRFRAWREGSSIRFEVESPRVRPALSTIASIVSDSLLFRDLWSGVKARRSARV